MVFFQTIIHWYELPKIEAILCKYMDKLDGQEVKLPVVMPADLWKNLIDIIVSEKN